LRRNYEDLKTWSPVTKPARVRQLFKDPRQFITNARFWSCRITQIFLN
jgi:hypothetical protein